MRRSIRLLAALVAVLSLLSVTALFFTSSAAVAEEDDVHFKKKIVSVLYDNSGSMNDVPDRLECAKYALGTLTALLNTTDTLVITPLYSGTPGAYSETTKVSQGIVVDLSDESKRNDIVDELMANPVIGAVGATPAGPLDIACQQLYDRGYTNEDQVGSDKEYWLIIMTDGAFDGLSSTMEAHISTYVNANTNMNIVYMSMGKGAVDLSGSALTGKTNFDAVHSAEANDVCANMQKIANRLSGRYTLPQTEVKADGNKVTIDLSECGYAVRSVSFVAQNCKVSLKSATHGSQKLTFKQGSSIHVDVPDDYDGDMVYDGYSAVISGSSALESGSVQLVFDGNVDPKFFSVMIEPALSVRAIPLAYIDGKWTAVDTQYINDKMRKGDEIRVTYEVLEEGSGKVLDLNTIFGECTATILANGKDYTPDTNIPLQKGANAIKMMVSVLNGAYTVPAYLYCYVQEDENAFRVDATLESNYGGSVTATNSLFTLYYDSKKVDKAGLSQFKLSATLQHGDESEEIAYTVLDDGRISIPFDMAGKPYGSYKINLSATSLYNVTKAGITTFANYPQTVVVTPDGKDRLEMTHHAFRDNKEGFSFILKADGEDFVFNNGITSYTVTYNNQDVTADCLVEGNRLTFTPTFEKTVFGTIGSDGVTEEVVVSITSSIKPELKSVAKATVKILPTAYVVEVLKGPDGEVDRFKLSENEVSAYFAVTVDGKEYLTKEQLEAAVTNGELIIDSPYYEKGILPFSSQVSYTEIEGTPAVRYCVKEGHPGIFRYLITTFFVTKGERPVSATYFAQGMTASVQNESGISIAPAGVSGILNYVFRVILILLIIWAIHVLLVLATIFRVSPRHPRGRFMKIIVDAYAPNYNPKVEYTNVNVRTSTRFIYKRLFPFCFKTPQKDKGCGEMKMKVVDRDSFQFSIDSPDECIIYDSDRRISNPKGVRTLNEFIELVANREMPEYIDNLTNETLCDMFSHDHIVFEGGHAANLVVPGKPYPFTHDAHTPYLAFYSGNTLLYVVCFVPFTNQ